MSRSYAFVSLASARGERGSPERSPATFQLASPTRRQDVADRLTE